MNNTVTTSRESKEINLIDLFWYIFSKWKTLLVWAVIGMVLVGGYKTVSDMRSTPATPVQEQAQLEEQVLTGGVDWTTLGIGDKLRLKSYGEANLVVNEAAQAQIDNLFNYVDRINHIEKLKASSEKYKINPTSEYVVSLQYNIDNGRVINYTRDIDKDYSDRLSEAYVSLTSRADLRDECAKALDIDESYVGELISASAGRTADILNVSVIASTSDRAEKLADIIDSYIKSAHGQLAEEIGSHKLTLISRGAKTVADEELYNWQMSFADSIYAYQNAINSTLPSFTVGQIFAFEKQLRERCPEGLAGITTRPLNIIEIVPTTGERRPIIADYETTEACIEENKVGLSENLDEIFEDIETQAEETARAEEEARVAAELAAIQAATPSFSMTNLLKYALIGFVVGLLVAAVWFACVYIFGKKVKNVDELAGYGMSILGDTSHAKENNKTAVDRLRYKKAMPLADAKALAFVNTRVVLQKIEGKRLIVSTMKLQGEVLAMANELIADLKANGVEVELADGINFSGAAIEKLASAQSVVFVEKLGTLRYDQIEAALTKCVRQSVDVSGAILL